MWRNFINTGSCVVAGLILAGCVTSGGQTGSVASVANDPVPDSVRREYSMAIEKMAQNDDAAAILYLEEFVANYPQYPGAYVNLAIVYDRQQKTEQAVWLLNRALEVDPAAVSALNRLGLIQRREGKFGEAEAAWLQATAADPAYANAWFNLGVLYDLYLQDLPAAIDHYRRYEQLTAATSDPLTAVWIADLERRVGEPARAAQARDLQ